MKETLPKLCPHGKLKSQCSECAVKVLKYHKAKRRLSGSSEAY